MGQKNQNMSNNMEDFSELTKERKMKYGHKIAIFMRALVLFFSQPKIRIDFVQVLHLKTTYLFN